MTDMIAMKFIPDWMEARNGYVRNSRAYEELNRVMREYDERWDRFNLHPEYENVVSDILDNADPEVVKLAKRLSKRMHTRNFGTKAALEVLMRVGILLASLEEDDET